MLKNRPLGSEFKTMLIFSLIFHMSIALALIFHNKFSREPKIKTDDKITFMLASPVNQSKLEKQKNKLPGPIVRVTPKPSPKAKKAKIVIKKKVDKKRKPDKEEIAKKKIEKNEDNRETIEKTLADLYSQLEKRKSPNPNNYSKDDSSFGFSKDGLKGAPESAVRYQYKLSLKSSIESNWFLINKSVISEMNVPYVIVTIKVNAKGDIISRKIDKSSGNDSFDKSVLRAIDRSDPLPEPPESLITEALTEGIEFKFVPPQEQ